MVNKSLNHSERWLSGTAVTCLWRHLAASIGIKSQRQRMKEVIYNRNNPTQFELVIN